MVERDGWKPRPVEEKFDAGSQGRKPPGKDLVPHGREGEWYERDLPHKELVKNIQGFLEQERDKCERSNRPFDPIRYISDELYHQMNLAVTMHENKEEEKFFRSLRNAWDVLTFDHYEPGGMMDAIGGRMLRFTDWGTRTRQIQLEHPQQVKLLDALTDAVGVEHEQGQRTIPIPDRLAFFDQWLHSKEYADRVAEAHRRFAEKQRKKNM